jgi:hypothetical protein
MVAFVNNAVASTPIINGLMDMYGCLRFLKIRPWYDFDQFHSHVSKLEKKDRKFVNRLNIVVFLSSLCSGHRGYETSNYHTAGHASSYEG